MPDWGRMLRDCMKDRNETTHPYYVKLITASARTHITHRLPVQTTISDTSLCTHLPPLVSSSDYLICSLESFVYHAACAGALYVKNCSPSDSEPVSEGFYRMMQARPRENGRRREIRTCLTRQVLCGTKNIENFILNILRRVYNSHMMC